MSHQGLLVAAFLLIVGLIAHGYAQNDRDHAQSDPAPVRQNVAYDPAPDTTEITTNFIGDSTVEQFQPISGGLVYLNSPGGFVEQAIYLGEMVRGAHMDTSVRAGTVCASACALIWLGGKHRYLHGQVKFHAPWTPDGYGGVVQSRTATRICIDWYRSLGLSERFISWSLKPSFDMVTLTPQLASELGVRIDNR